MSLGELIAALKVWAEHQTHAIPVADIPRFLIGLLSDHNPIIEQGLVDPDGLLQEVVVMETDRDRFDFHLIPTKSNRTRHFSRWPFFTHTAWSSTLMTMTCSIA